MSTVARQDPLTWGDLLPRRLCEWRKEEEAVILLVPRFGKGRLGRWLSDRFRASPYKVHLDEVGSFVWTQCSGDQTVASIVAAMREHFGEVIEPAEARLTLFLKQLQQGAFVGLSPPR